MTVHPASAAVAHFLDIYPVRDIAPLILHCGSTLHSAAPAACLDIDLLALVRDTDPQGDASFFVEGQRVDVIVLSPTRVLQKITKDLPLNSRILGRMILTGVAVHGDTEGLESLRCDVSEVFASAQPFFVKAPLHFAASSHISVLKRAKSREDIVSATYSALGFLGKSDGPLRGRWQLSEKHYLRELARGAAHSNEARLLDAIYDGLAGNPSRLIDCLEAWIREHELPPLDHVVMLHPPQGNPPPDAPTVALAV